MIAASVRCGNHVAGGEVVVGMADSGDRHLHQHLAVAGRVERDLLHLPVVANAAQYGCLTLHRDPPRGFRPIRRSPCAAAARIRPIANRAFRREYGYQSTSLDCTGSHGVVIACGRQYFSNAVGTTVARSDAGVLPPGHRQGEAEAVGHDVVDVDRSGLEPARHPLAPLRRRGSTPSPKAHTSSRWPAGSPRPRRRP